MPAYAHCPHCGLDFESQAIKSNDFSENITIRAQEDWRRCGQWADTTFNEPEPVTVINAPRRSRELIQRMQQQLREVDRIANSKRLPDGEASARIGTLIDAIEKESPEVAAEYRRRTEGQPRKAWSVTAKSITAALAVVGGYNTVADFVDRVSELVTYFSGTG